MFTEILARYEVDPGSIIRVIKGGLINTTWHITAPGAQLVLQRINDQVFKKPGDVAENIEQVGNFLSANHPGYFFVHPLKTATGENMIFLPAQGYFRMFPYIENSYTFYVAEQPAQAFEAALQFGRFTQLLDQFPTGKLKITLPGFHNLLTRYDQFDLACFYGNEERIKEAAGEIKFLRSNYHIVHTYKKIISSTAFTSRVIHHDTKISNVLFDASGKGICVIDLDTIMPGYFISDVGDMIRTYVSPVSEEEKDLTTIEFRDAYFIEIVKGYLEGMQGLLSEEESAHFVYAGMFMIYMQAMRFLTDYLGNDTYYGASYPAHNYVRAKNQVVLLQKLLEKEKSLNEMVNKLRNPTKAQVLHL